jgi:hypothetical protein
MPTYIDPHKLTHWNRRYILFPGRTYVKSGGNWNRANRLFFPWFLCNS